MKNTLHKPGFFPVLPFLLLALTAYSQGSWVQLQPMPQAAGFMSGAAYNGKIYLFGGAPTINSSTDKAYRYDPADQTFTALPSLPQATCGAGVVELNGKLYVIGGGSAPLGAYFSTVRVFDPQTETWGTAASLPEPRSLFTAGVIDGKIYVAGGGDQFGGILNSTVVYDPVTDAWTTGPAMPTARAFTTGAVLHDRLYVLGGLNNPAGLGLAEAEALDPPNGWSALAPLPTPRWGLSAAAVADKLFAFGGSDWNQPVPDYSTVEMLHSASGTWQAVASMPTSRRMLAAVAIEGNVYTFGGIKGFSGDGVATNVVEKFDPGDLVPTFETGAASSAGWLGPGVPNPFMGSTLLRFYLDRGGNVQIQVFDLQGRQVHTAFQGLLPAGRHDQILRPPTLKPGVYLVRLLVDNVDRGSLKIVASR
jgi:N-acetylneuraminic acid mutarotase